MTESKVSAAPESVTKAVQKERWQLVPVDIDDDIAESIAGRARCCGGGAFEIWNAALEAAPVHPLSQNPHSVERLKVCSPGYIGPANLDVVHAGDYDALLALLDDPDYPAKHARRLIAELRAKVAELEVEKQRLDHIEENWFSAVPQGGIEFNAEDRWLRSQSTVRGTVDEEIEFNKGLIRP